ncbi:type II toxin-antitoxin system MqsA family antitoxin [Acinetobacter baumannii]|uniref:type II toxin-antitoxin system MqsA family antitoxin n=1 Tax=Acinetobacter baumannii TaxID=470 RepID=UPI001FD5FC5B|nr:type II toxin-antitoxin system MqsA family antitoxin [Acinetobacter baumannii]
MTQIGTKCTACGEGVLQFNSRIRKVEYKDTFLNIEIIRPVCTVCGASIITNDLKKDYRRKLNLAKKEYDGLLSGEEIKCIRKKYNLTQPQASELFGGGPVAFAKYEKDDILHSIAMDKLLRVARDQALCFRHLEYLADKSQRRVSKIVSYYDDSVYIQVGQNKKEKAPVELSQKPLFVLKESHMDSYEDYDSMLEGVA